MTSGSFDTSSSELEKYAAIFSQMPAAIAVLRGPTFIFEMVNDSYCQLVGRAHQTNLVGKALTQALPELIGQPFPDLLKDVFESGETFNAKDIEAKLRLDPHSDRLSTVYLDIMYRRILDSEGRPYAVFVFASDVTEKVLGRLSIQVEQQKLDSVFSNASASLAILSGPSFVYEKANSSYINLFNGREIVGKPVLEALPELRDQKFPQLLQQVFDDGKPYVEIAAEAHLRRTATSPIERRFFDQSYTRIEDKKGKPYGVLMHAIDVTDRVLDKQALNEALKGRDDLLSICSHELRTPVASMKLTTQMFLRGIRKQDERATSPERVLRMVEQADRQLDRLTVLIEDMLDFSRISGGSLNINPSLMDLTELVRETLERLRPQFEAAGCTVTLEAFGQVSGQWDHFRLEQVLTNLITNALKYGEGKPVRVAVSQDGESAVIAVIDQGLGIAVADQKRIFKPYERAVSVNNISGLGLGLYISSQIIKAHQGRIDVKSVPLKGSTFTISLPKIAAQGIKNEA